MRTLRAPRQDRHMCSRSCRPSWVFRRKKRSESSLNWTERMGLSLSA